MYHFELSSGLSIKELDPYNPKDVWLASELDKDKEIQKYLWSITSELEKMQYNRQKDPYTLGYALYKENKPIGYFEFLHMKEYLYKFEYVYLSYGLLEQERKKGFATIALKDTSKLLLEDTIDIDKVILCIDFENEESINVAFRAGFVENGMEGEYLHFEKTKAMLKRERCLH